mmetsp:Transcript_7125/g.12498  ORF Transcript_7125/g.12498 Transcript_7125/m.12498 type:complete len:305 (+) Transcript_7125:42-956(+)
MGKGNQIGEVDTNDVLNASVMKIIKASAKNCSEVDIMAVKERLKADPNYKLYKRRFRFIPKLMTFLSIVAILQAPSFLFMLAAFAIMYVWIDVYSGILHVNLDNPNFLSNPVISESVLEFHWHHRFPQDIATRCFADVCGDLNMLIMIRMLLLVTLLYSGLVPTSALLCVTGFGVLAGYANQFGHRSAHQKASTRHPVADFLQRQALLLEPSNHRSHHRHQFNLLVAESKKPLPGQDEKPSDLPAIKQEFPNGSNFPAFHGLTSDFLQSVLVALPYENLWLAAFVVFTVIDLPVIAYVLSNLPI